MSSFQSFRCSECGSPVALSRGAGRTREYARGYHLPIPDDFEIPTCTGCGETYIIPEIAKRLDGILRRVYLRMQAAHYRELVDILIERHGVTQRDIVRACGVTPSYLSHVLAGKRQASTTLTRLLEAFTADRREFERHLADRPWTRNLETVPLYPVKRPGRAQDSAWTSPDVKWIGGAEKNSEDDGTMRTSSHGCAENAA